MDELVASRNTTTKPELFSDLFGSMLWILDQETLNVTSVFEEWMREIEDPYKIEIALSNTEIFPFITDEEFERTIYSIKKAMPQLVGLCDKIAHNRKNNN